jgi:hypothetical protein
MLERRAGEDTFKRLLQRIVLASCYPPAAGARFSYLPKCRTYTIPSTPPARQDDTETVQDLYTHAFLGSLVLEHAGSQGG